MSEAFDPYYELLGIPPQEQPPHHYRLLGVTLFETNAGVISNAAARQMSYVRSFGAGEHQDALQKLLNELAAAKLCLLKPQDKADYDQRLRVDLAAKAPAAPEPEPEPAPPPAPGTPVQTARFPPPSSSGAIRRPTISARAGERSWVVGSSSGCDLVIDNPTVSRAHCRLTLNSQGMFLEDLQSRNGTFVNRQRITGRVAVSPNDMVTLGTRARLPWPPECRAKIRDAVIRIGRDPANDVVLDDEAVSAHHARILVRGGHMELEDLGSAEGTFVGNLERRIQRCPVEPSDLLYFGKNTIRTVRELVEPIAGK